MKFSRSQRRGAALLYAAALMAILFGIASLVVDYGRLLLAKRELRSTVDAACLAGTSGLSVSATEARSRAKAVAAANKVNGKPLTLLDSDIELGTWNSATRQFTKLQGSNEAKATTLRINAHLSQDRGTAIDLVFLPILGGARLCELSAVAAAGTGVTSSDIVIVQDVTQSFADELSDAKAGDRALLDSLYNNGGKSAFGLVAFSGRGKTIAPLQTISGNYNSLRSKISSLALAGSSGMPVSSGTDIAAGIEQGITVFDNYTNKSAARAMIIVSDGEPTNSSNGAHPTLNAKQLLALAQSDATVAWSKKIHVYVVFFNRDNDKTAANNLRSLIRGDGVFVQVSDPKKLPDALASLTQMLPTGLVW